VERAPGSRSAGILPRLPVPGTWTTFAFILVLHGAYVLWTGVLTGMDSQVYDHFAGRLIETGFNLHLVQSEVHSSYPAILYLLFVTLVVGLKLVFGGSWPVALVAINLLAHAGLGALLVRLTARAVATPVAVWTCLLFYLFSYDLLQWTPYVLSDTSFVFIIFTIFALAADRIMAERGNWAPVFGGALAAIFYRPTGIVLLPDLAWAFYLARSRRSRIPRGRIFAFLCAAALAGALLFAWILQHPPALPDGAFRWTLEETMKGYRIGEIVHDRPDTFHAPPAGTLDYLGIIGGRFLAFFTPTASTFDLVHDVAQWAFFLPAYGLAAWFAFLLLRGRTALAPRARDVCFAALGAIFAYGAVHALLQVDYDWRYRMPIIPHLILLAAAGASELARRVAPRSAK
jgi:hypothetical protein